MNKKGKKTIKQTVSFYNMKKSTIDSWYLDHLVCPRDKSNLQYESEHLVCEHGHQYPVVEGIPVMLISDVRQTIPLAKASMDRAKEDKHGDSRAPELYLESLGISDEEKQGIVELAAKDDRGHVDPVVSFLVGATSGYMYEDLIGKLNEYPIPDIRLPDGNGELLLDLGCSWGRWCIAAAKKNYQAIGVDPSLGAVLAARRAAKDMGYENRYIVADARFLPFPTALFDRVFSYSVLQHMDIKDVNTVLGEVKRVMTKDGFSLIQMASKYGIRSLYHRLRMRGRHPVAFEVRYLSPNQLNNIFSVAIGESSLSADCFFGLGLQSADANMMPPMKKKLLSLSNLLVRMSRKISWVKTFADSIYVTSQKNI